MDCHPYHHRSCDIVAAGYIYIYFIHSNLQLDQHIQNPLKGSPVRLKA